MSRLLCVLVLLATPLSASETSFGTYTYDGAGNVKTAGSNRYVYDGAGRLVTATVNNGATTQRYAYDAFGNITEIDTAGQKIKPGVDPASNRMSLSQGAGIDAYATYDAAGNEVRYLADPASEFDAVGMMRTSRGTQLYIYTAADERIATTDLPARTQWQWTVRGTDGNVLREYTQTIGASPQWQWKRDYVYRDGTLLASVVPGATGGETIRHYHLDHLGTPGLITGPAGTLVSRDELYPFGADVTFNVNDPERLHFTGHERDYVGGTTTPNADYVDYMHARYYRAGVGRFLSVDPANDVDLRHPQSWNKYTYAHNNPINNTDPTGRCTNSIICLNYGFDQEITVTAPPPEIGSPWEEAVSNIALGMAAEQETAEFLAAGPAAAEAGLQETFPQLAVAFPFALGAVQGGATAAMAGAEGRVFWSGGDLAKNAAAHYARANGGSTLEMTAAGQAMEQRIATVGWEAARADTAAASRSWAQGAAGEVSVIQAARGVSMQSMWRNVEYPALMANPNVTSIRYFVATPSGKLIPVP